MPAPVSRELTKPTQSRAARPPEDYSPDPEAITCELGELLGGVSHHDGPAKAGSEPTNELVFFVISHGRFISARPRSHYGLVNDIDAGRQREQIVNTSVKRSQSGGLRVIQCHPTHRQH